METAWDRIENGNFDVGLIAKGNARLAVIFQNPARNHFWEAGIVMQSYMLDIVQ